MSRRVAVHVHIAGHRFAPGDVVPDELVAKVKNPAIWADDEPAAALASEPGTGPDTVPEPPRSGRGSGRESWEAYAAQHGVEVPEHFTRDDIVKDLVERGIVASQAE